jgi:hypothetical protein
LDPLQKTRNKLRYYNPSNLSPMCKILNCNDYNDSNPVVFLL